MRIPFKEWLADHGPDTIDDVVSRVARWERSFNDDLDDFLDRHGGQEAVDRCNQLDAPRKSIADVKTAVRHYCRFRAA